MTEQMFITERQIVDWLMYESKHNIWELANLKKVDALRIKHIGLKHGMLYKTSDNLIDLGFSLPWQRVIYIFYMGVNEWHKIGHGHWWKGFRGFRGKYPQMEPVALATVLYPNPDSRLIQLKKKIRAKLRSRKRIVQIHESGMQGIYKLQSEDFQIIEHEAIEFGAKFYWRHPMFRNGFTPGLKYG